MTGKANHSRRTRGKAAVIVAAVLMAVMCPGLAFGSYAGQGPDGRAALESAARAQGMYVMVGSVSVHRVDAGWVGNPTVASLMCDSPVEYTARYRSEVYQDSASDVDLADSRDEARLAAWSALDKRHVAVCCGDLMLAYHDGSYYGDAFASEDARLLYTLDAAGPEMCRLYNAYSGEHFYTADFSECAGLMGMGWQHEGIGWTAPETSSTPVFRLYNPYAGEHHYTMDAAERDSMVDAGWVYEDVGWYSDDAMTVPLFREYNPNEPANNHNYTTDKDEHDFLVSIGWVDEGYAWYGV